MSDEGKVFICWIASDRDDENLIPTDEIYGMILETKLVSDVVSNIANVDKITEISADTYGEHQLFAKGSPVALTDGVESLLSPLKLIKFPVHVIARIMSIALSFIPVFTEETARIMNAQKARGADFETGGLIKRIKALLPILVPLLISAFRRADELGDAMDARCYSGSKVRTKYKKLTFSWRDLLATLLVATLITGVVLLKIHTSALL